MDGRNSCEPIENEALSTRRLRRLSAPGTLAARGLVDLLNVVADRWVSNGHYEAATVAQMQAYEQLLQAVGSGENAY